MKHLAGESDGGRLVGVGVGECEGQAERAVFEGCVGYIFSTLVPVLSPGRPGIRGRKWK